MSDQITMEKHVWTNGILLGEYVDQEDYNDEVTRYAVLCQLWRWYCDHGCTPEEMYNLCVRFQEQHNKIKLVMEE